MYCGPSTGLWTSPNSFSATPDGSAEVADNVMFAAPSIIEPRRGMAELAGARFGASSSRADQIAFYNGGIFVAYDLTKVAFTGTPSGGFTPFAKDYPPNGNNRMRFEGAARSAFFNPSNGVQEYDTSGQPKRAGCQQGLEITTAKNSANGWMRGGAAVAYRYTICRKNFWGRVIEGAPSGRITQRNENAATSTPGSGGAMSRTANVVLVTTDRAHGMTVGQTVALSPGEANFVAGNKTVATVSSDGLQFTYAEVGANIAFMTVTENWTWSVTRSVDVTLWLGTSVIPGYVTTANFARVYRSEMTLAASDIPSDELFQCYETAYFSTAQLTAGFVTFQDVAPESVLEVPLYTNPNTGDGTLSANFQPPICEDMAYWQNRMWFLNTTSRHSVDLTLIGTGSPDGLQIGDTITVAPTTGIEYNFAAAAVSAGSDFECSTSSDPGYNIEKTARAFVHQFNIRPTQERFLAFYVSNETGTPGKIRIESRDFGDGESFSVFSSRATAWTPQLPTFAAPAFPALASTDNRHAARLCYSKLGQPEAVPLLNYEQVDADNNPALRTMGLNYRLLVWKTDGLYYVPTGFPVALQKLSDHRLLAPDSVERLGDAIYFLSDQGLMMVDDAGVRAASIPIDDTLTALGAPVALQNYQRRTVACAYRSARQYLMWTIEKDPVEAFSTDNKQAFVYSTLSSGFTRYTFGVRAAGVCPPGQAWGGSDQLLVAPTNDNILWLERKSLTLADYYDVGGVPLNVELVFNSLSDAEPASLKMVKQVSFLFKENSVPTITATFSSEINPAQEEVPLLTVGWGAFAWGETPWGGVVSVIHRVEALPPQTAVACQLSVGIKAALSGTSFKFLGIDVIGKKDSGANYG